MTKETEKIGTLTIKYDDDTLYTYDILSNKNITFYNKKIYIQVSYYLSTEETIKREFTPLY